MDIMPRYLLPVLAALFIFMLGIKEGAAEFALNFQPSPSLSPTPGIINLSCNRGEWM